MSRTTQPPAGVGLDQPDPLATRRAFLWQVAGTAALSLAGVHRLRAAEAPKSVSLRPAMDRAALCCLAWLNPEQNFLPTGGYEIAHDTGRWWDAMLAYETATQVPIPAPMERAMMDNLRTLTSNPAGLLASQLCNPHNLRETLLTYAALARVRRDDWAAQQGRKLVATIHELLEPDGQLDYEKLAARVGKPLTKDPLMTQHSAAGEWFNATATTGRALEAVVDFHEATSDPRALALAQRLAEIHLRNDIDSSGAVRAELLDPGRVGHTHSYCGTLRGLWRHGGASSRAAVAQTYRHGLATSVLSRSGWNAHDQGKIRFTNKDGEPVGEHASCGDVAQMALWLARDGGAPECLDDVERLVRARLLPSQITDPANPRRDGAWGVYSHPFGFGAILDVFAAVLHTVTNIQQTVVTTRGGESASVDLHFDADTPALAVRAERGAAASLRITVKSPLHLRVRVPGWAPRSSIRLSANGQPLPLRWEGPYLQIAKADIPAGGVVVLQHDLPEHQTVEELPGSHRQFRLNWRGDTVTACEPNAPIYP
jgi:hypothetical protein